MSRAEVFRRHDYPVADKLRDFPKFVGVTDLARFLARHEAYRRVLGVKGAVVEGGVRGGGSLFTWIRLSRILEPRALDRRFVGFDTFEGLPEPSAPDRGPAADPRLARGGHAPSHDVRAELEELLAEHRAGGPGGAVELVAGDAVETMPAWLERSPHALVALLHLDFDLYEPTKVALETFVPRMPRGAVLVLDEPDCPEWPGETVALLETLGVRDLRLERLPYEPNLAFAVL